MSDRPSFVAALREADALREQDRLSPGAVHRITRRLDAELLQAEVPPTRRRIWIPMVAFAAGAAMVLGVFAFNSGPKLATENADGAAPMHAAWHVGGANCHATRGETEIVLDGSCRVETAEPGLVIESRATTRLRTAEHGVALVDGTAVFEIDPVVDAPARRVEVPGGAIEVLGTRFAVVVRGDAGHVDLLEGSIRFVADDGRVHTVAPGERFHFSAQGTLALSTPRDIDAMPLAAGEMLAQAEDEDTPLAAGERLAALGAAPTDTKSHRGSRSRGPAAPSSDELRRIVDQVAELRAQRQYRAAVSLLRGALDDGWDLHTREVLSYELGTILSTQLSDRARACTHWAQHREQFPSGRYVRAIARAEKRLGCEP